MSEFWMVRAGEGGYLIGDFDRASCVAVGWIELSDLSKVQEKEELRKIMAEAYPDTSAAAFGNSLAAMHKFRFGMQKGDAVISYDPKKREYILGEITGDYSYELGRVPDYSHVRDVKWKRRINRDDLPTKARSTLSTMLTITQPGQDVYEEIQILLAGGKVPSEGEEGTGSEKDDLVEKAREFIKDRILKLDWEQMQDLVAAILRAMGYKTLVSPVGPDRGKDISASPDGLGLEEPRIKVQVKHRPKQQMGAPEIKSFLGGLGQSDKGLYVSTGGFSKEALYVADTATAPLTLVDLDRLANLLVQHYDNLDTEGRALVPLVRIFWPAS